MSLKILSIDGGGTRGIIPATILDCIQNDTGQSPVELFDLFAGTSTGGIICIGIAAGLSPAQLIDLYQNQAKEIFFESCFDKMQKIDELLFPNYNNTHFVKILDNLFGNKTLGDLHNDPNFGGKKKNLMVCSFDLAPNDPADRNHNYRPAIFHSEFVEHKDIKLRDLALMTTAAPTYFPIYQSRYIDGGVALNNPSMAAVAFAINGHKDGEYKLYEAHNSKGLNLELSELSLLSLSCGTGNKLRIDPSVVRSGNWGKIRWIDYLPDLITETNMQSTIYYLQQLLSPEQYLRIELFFDDANAGPLLNSRPVGLDVTDATLLNAMRQYAIKTYEVNKQDIITHLNRP